MVAIAVATIFFASCQDSIKEIRKMELASNEPMGEAVNILLKHTDSGRLKMQLSGDKMLDFSNDAFPYTEFPEGIHVRVYENPKDTLTYTTIIADRAMAYDETDLFDLRGNVQIINSDGNTFNGEQLYWDQIGKHIFTDQDFTIYLKDDETGDQVGVKTGSSMDANEELTEVTINNARDKFVAKSQNEL